MKEKRAVCICASDLKGREGRKTARRICGILCKALAREGCPTEILDLQDYALAPCTGCGECRGEEETGAMDCGQSGKGAGQGGRDRNTHSGSGGGGSVCCQEAGCARDQNFNHLYRKIEKADFLFFVSPHYAPIPAGLCMLLEKIKQLASLPGWKNPSYRPRLCGKLSGIISYGAEGEEALMNYKAMVNDTIADALGSARVKVVPFNSRWDTGISLPVSGVRAGEGGFPVEEYDWKRIGGQVETYAEVLVQTGRTLHALL